MSALKEYNLEWCVIAPSLLYNLTVHRSDGLYIGEAFISKAQLIELKDKDALQRLIITMEDNRSKGVEIAFILPESEVSHD